MAQAALRHILFGLAGGGLLMGCIAGSGGGEGAATPGATGPAAVTRGTGAEIEAPEVFQTTDSALWDGRPSLGGIWVASPDAVDPERVVMFNPATGRSVNGALFRRERDNPGPKLQVSSDAAEALGMLAGQPTELRVTALRRDEPAPPVPEAAPPIVAGEVVAGGADPAAGEDMAAAAAPADPETAALAADALAATGVAAADAAGAAVAADAAGAAEEPRRKTWAERRAENKARREAERAAKAAAEAEAEAAATAAATGAAIEPPIEPVDPAAGAVAAIETAPLDARSPETVADDPAAAAAAAVAPAPAPAPAGARPIQIASFSREENANRAVEALAKIDIPAQALRSERNGTAVWGVVASGDAALLDKIRGAGFADAYFLQ